MSKKSKFLGSKHALEARLAKISELEKKIQEGWNALETLRKHTETIQDNSKMPPKVKEELQRDLAHIK